jgi:hypothetical protein
MPESKWVAQQLGRPVIKAFNNIFASHLLESGRPKGTPGRIALPVSGDDEAAKAIVVKLVDELGFDACCRAMRGHRAGGKRRDALAIRTACPYNGERVPVKVMNRLIMCLTGRLTRFLAIEVGGCC